MFCLTSLQDAADNYQEPQLVEEPLRLGLIFIFPLKHVTELIVLGERMSSSAVENFGVAGKNISYG